MSENDYAIVSDLAEVRILLEIVAQLRTVPDGERRAVAKGIDKWRERLEAKVREGQGRDRMEEP